MDNFCKNGVVDYRCTCMKYEKRRKGVAKRRKTVTPSPSTTQHVYVDPRPSSGLLKAIQKFKDYRKLGYTPVKLQVIVDLSDMEFFIG